MAQNADILTSTVEEEFNDGLEHEEVSRDGEEDEAVDQAAGEKEKTEETITLAPDIVSVLARIEDGEFPLVLCAEQTAVPPNEAENLLASLHEEEKLPFQRLLESTWTDHRATLQPTLTEDETVVHARWLIEHYYVDLNKYVLESQRRRSIADMLQPFVGGSDADATSASHICQIMANLQAMHVGRFATHLEETFGKMVANLRTLDMLPPLMLAALVPLQDNTCVFLPDALWIYWEHSKALAGDHI